MRKRNYSIVLVVAMLIIAAGFIMVVEGATAMSGTAAEAVKVALLPGGISAIAFGIILMVLGFIAEDVNWFVYLMTKPKQVDKSKHE